MKIEFYDCTLRDGAQAAGISYSINDKKAIFRLLSGFGIDLVEGGDPASNPKDAEFFEECRDPRLVAFGATRRKGVSASADAGLKKLVATGAKTVCIFGKASLSQVKEVLAVSPEEKVMDQQERQERERLYGMLREALETRLTDMQRRRLWMYYVEDLTIEEIAAEENVKHQNIYPPPSSDYAMLASSVMKLPRNDVTSVPDTSAALPEAKPPQRS